MESMRAWGSPGSPDCPAKISKAHNRFNPPAGVFGIMLQFLSILLPCPGQTSTDSWVHPPCLHPSVPSHAPCQGVTWAVPSQHPPKPLLMSQQLQACSTRQSTQLRRWFDIQIPVQSSTEVPLLKRHPGKLNLHPGSEMQIPISHPPMMETSIGKKASQARSNRQPQRPPADMWPPLPAPITTTSLVHSQLCEPPALLALPCTNTQPPAVQP